MLQGTPYVRQDGSLQSGDVLTAPSAIYQQFQTMGPVDDYAEARIRELYSRKSAYILPTTRRW